jgi:hypothetical protein
MQNERVADQIVFVRHLAIVGANWYTTDKIE